MEIASVRTNKLLAIGSWYNVHVGKFGSKVFLSIDNTTNSGLLGNNGLISLSGEAIYLGK